MQFHIYTAVWLFFVYGMLGWVAETIVAAARYKRFENRGVVDGPFCTVYGVAGVVLAMTLTEQSGNLLVQFVGSAVFCTLIEWIAGHLLEKTTGGRWWDYSNRPLNLDGYICLPYSLLWGVLGVLGLRVLNPLLALALAWIPAAVGRVVLWVLLALYLVDSLGAYSAMRHLTRVNPAVREVNHRLAKLAWKLAGWITGHVERRLSRSYPNFLAKKPAAATGVFAAGCSFYKLVWLFVIGSLLGDFTETIFCRITAGVWMSRSSLVWGPFSIVWGFAIALATALLHRYRDRSGSFLFWFGTVLGGAYEYFCSVVTEVCFGTVFWDYSAIPFNLGGRINLLYCFFWGIAAVVWLKFLYPRLSGLIEKIPPRPGVYITWALVVFMALNMLTSALAMARYDARSQGIAPTSAWQQLIDSRFPDERMEKNYPNAIRVEEPAA